MSNKNLEGAIVAIANTPVVVQKWNQWLDAYGSVEMTVGDSFRRTICVRDLPRYGGHTPNDFRLMLLTLRNNDLKMLFLVGRLLEMNKASGAIDRIAKHGAEDFFFRGADLKLAIEAIANTPMVMGGWNSWLDAYGWVEVTTNGVTRRVSNLPRFNGRSVNDFKLMLLQLHAEDPGALFLVGHLLELNKANGAINRIAQHSAERFFFASEPITAGDVHKPNPSIVSLGHEVDGHREAQSSRPSVLEYCRAQLNTKWASWSEERKDARIQSVLSSVEIANKIRARVPHLLPDATTLWDLVQRGNAAWPWPLLAVALVDWAERKLAQEVSTFTLSDTRRSLVESAQLVEDRAPFRDLALFAPNVSQEDREAMWPDAASKLMSQYELAQWLGDEDLAHQELSQRERNVMLDDLLRRLGRNVELRAQVLQAVHKNVDALPQAERWTVLLPTQAIGQLLQSAPTTDKPVAFTADTAWNAARFLSTLGIHRPGVEQFLAQFNGDKIALLKHASADDLVGELKTHGADFFQALTIKEALTKQGRI